MEHIKAVIFDLDNTILDRTRTFRKFTGSFLEKFFPHLESTEDMLEWIIDLDEDGYKDKHELFSELLDELPWITKPELAELLEFYNTEYVRNAVLMDQAKEVLQHLRSKIYKTGLVTNGRTTIQLGKVDQLGIRQDFDVIIVSEEAGFKKPDSRIFQMALEKLNMEPEQCIFIGDHPSKDIEGAANVGMHTIWIKVNQPWNEELKAKPLHTIDSLSALIDII